MAHAMQSDQQWECDAVFFYGGSLEIIWEAECIVSHTMMRCAMCFASNIDNSVQ